MSRVPRIPGGRWLLLVLALLAGGAGLLVFAIERDNADKPFRIGRLGPAGGIAVTSQVVDVDPEGRTMSVRISYEPVGALAAPGGFKLARDVELFVNTIHGDVTTTASRGDIINPAEVELPLEDGDVLDYPFDSYRADLAVIATSPEGRVIPTGGTLLGLNGWSMDTRVTRRQGVPVTRVDIRRVDSTIAWAVFVMLLMWVLCLAALRTAVMLSTGRRTWSTVFLGFFAAMLFAFPAIRNNLPGSPPIGSLNDFVSFFWAEGLIAVSLLIGLLAWQSGRLPPTVPKPPPPDASAQDRDRAVV
jgi:hypothetical protein